MPIPIHIFDTFPILKTPRLSMREILPSDAQAIYEMRANGRVNQFIPRDNMQELLSAEDLVRKTRQAYQKQQGIGWAGLLRDQGEIIGTCGFNSIDEKRMRAEIGGELATEYWGKRIAQEAVEAIIEFGFKEMKLQAIEAKVSPNNRGAIFILRQMGFREEAYYEDYVSFQGQLLDLAVYVREC